MTVHVLLGVLLGFLIEQKLETLLDAAIVSDDIRAVVSHRYPYFGDCNPGDVSHWFMREAVSACRALRTNWSRSIPGGRDLACSLRRNASCASRSSKEAVCLILR